MGGRLSNTIGIWEIRLITFRLVAMYATIDLLCPYSTKINFARITYWFSFIIFLRKWHPEDLYCAVYQQPTYISQVFLTIRFNVVVLRNDQGGILCTMIHFKHAPLTWSPIFYFWATACPKMPARLELYHSNSTRICTY